MNDRNANRSLELAAVGNDEPLRVLRPNPQAREDIGRHPCILAPRVDESTVNRTHVPATFGALDQYRRSKRSHVAHSTPPRLIRRRRIHALRINPPQAPDGALADTQRDAQALLLRHLEALEVRMLKDLALYLSTITAGFGIGVRELPRELRDQPIHGVDAREQLRLVS